MAFRVLSLDGGGMRGLYTATYLQCLANAFEKKRGIGPLDIGAAFNLIVGTSTGAIIACALAVGVPLDRVGDLYRTKGQAIFPRRLPTDQGVFKIYRDLRKRPSALKSGTKALRAALSGCFGTITVGDLYATRKIALAIPAIELGHHNSFVFKTAHLPNSMHRDDNYQLVDVCLASSAAPVYRSLARSRPRVITSMFKSRSLLKDAEFVSGTTMSTSSILPFFVIALRQFLRTVMASSSFQSCRTPQSRCLAS